MYWWHVGAMVLGWEWLRTLLRTVYHLVRRGVIPLDALIYAAVTLGCVLVWMGAHAGLLLGVRHIRQRMVQHTTSIPATTVAMGLWGRRVVLEVDLLYWLEESDRSWGYVVWCGLRLYLQLLVIYVVIAWWW